MSMTSDEIKNKFKDLLSFDSKKDQHKHDAKILIAQYVNHILSTMESTGMKRKYLAEQIDTSSSFITQLFRGDKLINFITLAKIQDALKIKFQVSVKFDNGIFSNLSYLQDEEQDGYWVFHANKPDYDSKFNDSNEIEEPLKVA